MIRTIIWCAFVALLFIWHSCQQSTSFNSNEKASPLLSSIIKTYRISSNHYSEIVTDSIGNSYIASFSKKADDNDYIHIIKVDPNGKLLWIKGSGFGGRATAISLSHQQTILVAGWADTELRLDGYSIKEDDSEKVFIAELDRDGKCLNLQTFSNDGIFNIHSNDEGSILISGVCNNLKTHVSSSSSNFPYCSRFIASLDENLNVNWIKPFDGHVVRIKNKNNYFYLTGKFKDSLQYDSYALHTEGPMDEDGFLLKINPNGDVDWLRQFGKKGAPFEYQRSNETGGDIAFDHNKNILISALINSQESKKYQSLNILQYDDYGNLISDHLLLDSITNSITTLNIDSSGDIWISGNRWSHNSTTKTKSFLMEYSPEMKSKKWTNIEHGKNTILRSSYYNSRTINYTGHFQDFITVGKDSLVNQGEHELFIYHQKVD